MKVFHLVEEISDSWNACGTEVTGNEALNTRVLGCLDQRGLKMELRLLYCRDYSIHILELPLKLFHRASFEVDNANFSSASLQGFHSRF